MNAADIRPIMSVERRSNVRRKRIVFGVLKCHGVAG
jgi:hypothetical protein